MAYEAETDHPVHELIRKRRSPYAYVDKPVAKEDLVSLFEAARWAASSYNEQPWRFIVATKENAEEYEKALSVLVEGNQVWAKHAPVIVIGTVVEKFALNGNPNIAAEHDLGLALGNLSIEATARGLYVHPMIGLEPEKAREIYGIPEDAHALTAFAIGYVDRSTSEVPEDILKRDDGTPQRKPLPEIVFGGAWGSASGIVE